MLFLTTRPLWVLILLLIFFTGLAMAVSILIRRHFGLEKLRTNNEVAGFKFAVIGVLYAVLLGFAVVIAWERYHDAERALAAEAGAAASIYRLAGGLDPTTTVAVRDRLATYMKSILEEDWPAMSAGRWSRATTRKLNDLYTELVGLRPSDPHDFDLHQDLLRELDKLSEARRERLVMAQGTVPDAVWFVIFFGGALTIAFTYFFGTQNELTQCLMTGVLAALIHSAILVIIAIDRPFTGAVVVSRDPIEAVLEDLPGSP